MSGSGAAAVFGPGIAHVSMMCGDDTADLVQLPGRESAIRGQCRRFEPEFAGVAKRFPYIHPSGAGWYW
jgi:hypothetical protein